MVQLKDALSLVSLFTLAVASCAPKTGDQSLAPKGCAAHTKDDLIFANSMLDTSGGASITSEPWIESLPPNCVLIIVNDLTDALTQETLKQVTFMGIEQKQLDANGTAANMACGNLDPFTISDDFAPPLHPEVKGDCVDQNTEPKFTTPIAGVNSPVTILLNKNQAIFRLEKGTNLIAARTNLRSENRINFDQMIARMIINYTATLGDAANGLTFHRIDTSSHVAPSEQFQQELLPYLPTLVPPTPTFAAPIYTQTPFSPVESSQQNNSPEQLQLTDIYNQIVPPVHEVHLRITLGENDRDLYAFMMHPESADGNAIRVQSVRNDRIVLESIEELLAHAQKEQNKNEFWNSVKVKVFEVPSVASDVTFSNTTLDHIVLFSLNLPGGEKGYVTVDAATLTDPTLTLPVPLYYIKITKRHADNTSLVALDVNGNEIPSATELLNREKSWDIERNTSKYNGAYVIPSEYLTYAQTIAEPSSIRSTVEAMSKLQKTITGQVVGTGGILYEVEIPVGIPLSKPSNNSCKTGPEEYYGVVSLSLGMAGLPGFIDYETKKSFEIAIRAAFNGELPPEISIVIPLTNALIAPFPEDKESSLLPQVFTPSAYLIQQPLLTLLDTRSIVEIREADKPKLTGKEQKIRNRETLLAMANKARRNKFS